MTKLTGASSFLGGIHAFLSFSCRLFLEKHQIGFNFLPAHVLHQLLSEGYHVRGTVRSPRKAGQIAAKYAHDSKLELVVVKDLAVAGSLDGVLSGAVGVVHGTIRAAGR